MDLFLLSVKKGLLLTLDLKILASIVGMVFCFFVASLCIHWPREKESRILKALYTALILSLLSALLVIVFFPLFFGQEKVSSITDILQFFLSIERIVLAAFVVFLLSVLPVIGKVMMDLSGLQFYFAGIFIFNACISKSDDILSSLNIPVLGTYESLGFFLLAMFLSTTLFYFTRALTSFLKGWLKDIFSRAVSLIGGIVTFIIYTQLYFFHLVS